MRIVKWFLIPLLILLLLLAFIPQIASTSFGKPIFLTAIDARLGGKTEIQSLHLSWLGPQKLKQVRFSRSDVQATADELTIQIPLWKLSDIDGHFSLKNGNFLFPAFQNAKIEQVNGEMKGNDFRLTGVTKEKQEAGVISIEGKIFESDHFDLKLHFKNLPVAALDALADTKGFLAKSLGSSLDLDGTVSLNQKTGPVQLNLSSSNAKATIQGNLREDAFTLTEPLTATLHLTPELSDALLRDANPLFVHGIKAKNPVLLRLNADAFIPLSPFSIDKLQLSGSLDMGQVECKNGNSLATVIGLLDAKGLKNTRTMNIWFTPVQFELANGILESGRMDALLADSIHICTWGSINLKTEQLHLYLGLPADALKKSFGIKKLPENYVLKIPIRGTTRKPSIDQAAATTTITTFVATQKITKKGGVFGDVLNAFTAPQVDKTVPQANRPFPWESK